MPNLQKILEINRQEGFPVDPAKLKMPSTPVVRRTYDEAPELIEMQGYSEMMESGDGFPAYINGKYYIFYRSGLTPRRQFLVLHHEFGHIAAGQISGARVFSFTEEDEDEADDVARRLMAPADKLLDMGVTTAEEIHELTLVPMKDAVKVAQEIAALEKQREREENSLLYKGATALFALMVLGLLYLALVGVALRGIRTPDYTPREGVAYYTSVLTPLDYHLSRDCKAIKDSFFVGPCSYARTCKVLMKPCKFCRTGPEELLEDHIEEVSHAEEGPPGDDVG